MNPLAATALALGLTQAEIADACDLSQSQVSRVLAGKATARSKAYRRICAFMHVEPSAPTARPATPSVGGEIGEAIESVWNGTSAHATAIAGVIRSLGAFDSKYTES